MSRSIQLKVYDELLATRNYPDVYCPFFTVPLDIWHHPTKLFVSTDREFLWDTGANVAMIGRDLATRCALRLHDIDDRLPGGVGGVGGSQPAWLTKMKVRFPTLTRRRRDPDLAFWFYAIVLDQLDMPILGTRDVLNNFAVTTSREQSEFALLSTHEGEPIP